MITTIGGKRLGSGNRQDVELHGYGRSSHNLDFMFKNTQAPGTLVPFYVTPGLPGDTFDIELNAEVRTMPTIGPLFASFKFQLDVFTIPIRLYNRSLHNNKLNVGLKINSIKFPQIQLTANPLDPDSAIPISFQQINQSSLLAYLGIRGLGSHDTVAPGITAQFNAIPYIGYFDIFKNYYANKMENNAYIIHGTLPSILSAQIDLSSLPQTPDINSYLRITGKNITKDNVYITITDVGDVYLRDLGTVKEQIPGVNIIVYDIKNQYIGEIFASAHIKELSNLSDIKPELSDFSLENLDTIRDTLLSWNDSTPFVITTETLAPLSTPLQLLEGNYAMSSMCGQEGLLVKTYQSDIFNNWLKTDLIVGQGSISDLTKVAIESNALNLDTLNVAKKVYDLLVRVAVAGNTLEDYIEATYDHKSKWRAETPVYQGGLSKEIVFEQVISTAATENDPLGTLAGRGRMGSKHKGGKMIINIDEPSYIMGICSITPRVSYSQGNAWDVHLKSMDDLHKPGLDGIGYQDLIVELMHFGATAYTGLVPITKSAGKQPAWMNYRTNFDKNYGNFANPNSQMFMTLDRNYEYYQTDIKDLTTYIDPAKFNYAFAQTDLSAQNFWVQIAGNVTARRKMSTSQIPNL